MKLQDAETLVVIGVVGYLLWKVVPALNKTTSTVADWIAQFYEWATFPPSMIPLGNIVLPTGQLVPLTDVDVRQMPNGGTAALYAGVVYQLSPSDNNGNWPASPL